MRTADARFRARLGGVEGVLVMELERLVFRRAGDDTGAPPLLDVPLASLFRYEVTRNTHERSWSLSLVTVRWRLVLWGRVCETHSLLLPCDVDDDHATDSVDPDKDYALHVVESIDKTVFAWQRLAHSAPVPPPAVPSISLLQPQVGLATAASEAAQSTTAHAGDQSAPQESAARSTSLSSLKKHVTRDAPGECLFVDEVALERAGLVSSAQWYVLGPRFVGTWTAWNLGSTMFSTTSVAMPAVLAVTPLALTLFLPTVNFFCPFPVGSVQGWGASGSTFNFRFTATRNVSHVVSFSTSDAQAVVSVVEQSMAAMQNGAQPFSPLPAVYPNPVRH